MIIRLVLVRHGESEWNLKHEFTGWHDCDLSEHGRHEALLGGDALRAEGFVFDVAHTSLLSRAIHTLWIILDRMQLSYIPIKHSWHLNERHYGALQGLEKPEMVEIFGEQQVLAWRRSWDQAPPPLAQDDARHPRFDPRYKDLTEEQLPETESLKDCVERTLQYWYDSIVPDLKAGKRLIVVAHGNSLRGIVKMLDHISDADIANVDIPTGIPLVYELDEKDNFRPIRHYYLCDPDELQKRIEAVKNQIKR